MPPFLTLFIGWITQAFCVENINFIPTQPEILKPIHFIYEESDWFALPAKATSVCLYNIEESINDAFLSHHELESLRILANQIELSDPKKFADLKNLKALSISTLYPIHQEILNHLPQSLEYAHLSNLEYEDVMIVLNRLPDLMKLTVCLYPDTLSDQGKDALAIFDDLDEKRTEIYKQFPDVYFSFYVSPQEFALTNPFEGIPDHYLPHEKED